MPDCGRAEHFVVGGPPRKAVPTKADPNERSQQKAAITEAKRKFNPRTDLKVGQYKNNPEKKQIDRGCWILEMGR